MPLFEATVLESKPVPFADPGARRHSARLQDYRVTLRLEDGSILVIDRVFRDANWSQVAAGLVAGKKYRFPKALYEPWKQIPAKGSR